MEMARFANIANEPRVKEAPIDLGPNGMSIDLLRAVYRNPSIPLSVRIRCAVAALPHEVPRLMVTAQVDEQSFAELLDKRLARIDAMNASNGNGKAQAHPHMAPITAEVRKPQHHVTTNDKRYRRF
jgi:hypothetical protein